MFDTGEIEELNKLREAAYERAEEIAETDREKEILIQIMMLEEELIAKDALDFKTAKDLRDRERAKKEYNNIDNTKVIKDTLNTQCRRCGGYGSVKMKEEEETKEGHIKEKYKCNKCKRQKDGYKLVKGDQNE